MPAVSLELFKKHCRADDFTADDVYLSHILAAATAWVIQATNRTEQELRMFDGKFPEQLEHAIMMIGAYWYNQRESDASTSIHEVPSALQALIKPYRKLV